MENESQELKIHPYHNRLAGIKTEDAIDLTVFMGQWPSRLQSNATIEDLSKMADQYNLKTLCVSHIASIWGYDTRSGNEVLLKAARKDSRIHPYIIINPLSDTCEDELRWGIEQGAKGVRWIPGCHDYSLRDPKVIKCLTQIKEAGLPLSICHRLQDERLYHPKLQIHLIPMYELAEIIELTQGHGVILSGLRVSDWQEIQLYLTANTSVDHVVCDLWFVNGPIAAIEHICALREEDHFGYGSCYPIQVPEATILQLTQANIAETDRAKLYTKNAQRVLGVSEHAVGRSDGQ